MGPDTVLQAAKNEARPSSWLLIVVVIQFLFGGSFFFVGGQSPPIDYFPFFTIAILYFVLGYFLARRKRAGRVAFFCIVFICTILPMTITRIRPSTDVLGSAYDFMVFCGVFALTVLNFGMVSFALSNWCQIPRGRKTENGRLNWSLRQMFFAILICAAGIGLDSRSFYLSSKLYRQSKTSDEVFLKQLAANKSELEHAVAEAFAEFQRSRSLNNENQQDISERLTATFGQIIAKENGTEILSVYFFKIVPKLIPSDQHAFLDLVLDLDEEALVNNHSRLSLDPHCEMLSNLIGDERFDERARIRIVEYLLSNARNTNSINLLGSKLRALVKAPRFLADPLVAFILKSKHFYDYDSSRVLDILIDLKLDKEEKLTLLQSLFRDMFSILSSARDSNSEGVGLNSNVLITVATALGKLGGRAAVEESLALLKSSNEWHSSYVAHKIVEIRDLLPYESPTIQ